LVLVYVCIVRSLDQANIGLDEIEERMMIRQSIQQGRIEEGISLVNNLNPEVISGSAVHHRHVQRDCSMQSMHHVLVVVSTQVRGVCQD
jgi:hypothetical protein